MSRSIVQFSGAISRLESFVASTSCTIGFLGVDRLRRGVQFVNHRCDLRFYFLLGQRTDPDQLVLHIVPKPADFFFIFAEAVVILGIGILTQTQRLVFHLFAVDILDDVDKKVK